FETGRIFFQNHEGRHEGRRLALLASGEARPPHWRQKKQKADYHDIAGAVEALCGALHIPTPNYLPFKTAAFHPKRATAILAGNKAIGWLGEIHPELRQDLDTAEPLAAAELDTQALLDAMPTRHTYAPPSPFPPVRRDLSMVAPEQCP